VLLVSVAPSRLAELSHDPDVAYVSPDRPISKQMNNAAVGVLANYAWSLGYDGTGIAVAVIDCGVHGVDELMGRSRAPELLLQLETMQNP
jgi:hypothetical protein